MSKLFEMIGALMATACLVQLASSPADALKDIQRGPMPALAAFDRCLVTSKNYNKSKRLMTITVSNKKK